MKQFANKFSAVMLCAMIAAVTVGAQCTNTPCAQQPDVPIIYVHAANPAAAAQQTAGNIHALDDDNKLMGFYLTIAQKPQVDFAIDDKFTTEGLKVILAADCTKTDTYYDVTEITKIETDFDSSKPGDYKVTLSVNYETPFGRAVETDYFYVTVHDWPWGLTTATRETETTATSFTVHHTIPEEHTRTTNTFVTTTKKGGATATAPPYSPDYNPWQTLENGSTIYRGTNALSGVTLMIEKYPQLKFAVGEPLNVNGLQVFMTEQRRFNARSYDVSEMLDIWTDYNPKYPGTYTVYLSTKFAYNDARTDQILSYEVEVSNEMTTGPSDTSDSSTTTTITTAPVRGDIDGSGKLELADAVIISRILTDSWDGDPALKAENADMNGDKKIDARDLTLVKRFLLKG